ncbi:hypothetical protein OG455_33445 [Kitasatospora sp. NBC_01287]|uniref:hypothetical protein n=1 Tax=Kitasatospora sp. NBC_01287 TaxID=2903573 RepID=UPI00224F66EC|nr:hypothetical protein [Kitasatospora sp. NBC_01287]MCX4750360.1 hypothetical protein [Kitasatospora sp. NBC_01287]
MAYLPGAAMAATTAPTCKTCDGLAALLLEEGERFPALHASVQRVRAIHAPRCPLRKRMTRRARAA